MTELRQRSRPNSWSSGISFWSRPATSAGGRAGRVLDHAEIDESALTGESVPAAKDASELTRRRGARRAVEHGVHAHPGTHGSGVVVVTATGSGTQVGKIGRVLSATAKEETPLTKQMNTLTLWIVAAAGFTMIVMFVLGA